MRTNAILLAAWLPGQVIRPAVLEDNNQIDFAEELQIRI
jgi:hypothetical protein